MYLRGKLVIRIPEKLAADKLHSITSLATPCLLSESSKAAVAATDISESILTNEQIPGLESPVIISENNKKIAIEDSKPIGGGAFGKVYIGQDLETGEFVAVKKQNLFRGDQYLKEATEELEALRRTNQLVDFLYDNKHGDLYLVMPYAYGKNVYEATYTKQEGKLVKKALPDQELLDIAIAALKCVNYFHNVDKKVHRDLKLENIMWDKTTKTCKLIDLAKAVSMDADGNVTGEACDGTSLYVAPELFRDPCIYSAKSDIYAMGIFLLELMVSQAHKIDPWASMIHHIKNANAKGVSPVLVEGAPEIFANNDSDESEWKDIKNLIRGMVDSDPETRPTLDVAIAKLQHIKDLYSQMEAQQQVPVVSADTVREDAVKRSKAPLTFSHKALANRPLSFTGCMHKTAKDAISSHKNSALAVSCG